MATETAESTVKKPRPLWLALTIAVVLIFVPSLFLGPLLVPFIALWGLVALALSFRKKFASVRTLRVRNLGIYILAVIAAIANYAHGLTVAQERGQALVSALNAFDDANRRYPDSLEELVPKYIDHIPPALYGRFFYFNSAEAGPTFFYVTIPPFGRRGYCFAKKTGPCLGQMPVDGNRNDWYDFD